MRSKSTEIILSTAGAKNAVNIFLASKREGSRATYFYALQKLAHKFSTWEPFISEDTWKNWWDETRLIADVYSFKWWNLRYEHIIMIRAWLLKGHESSYVALNLTALKGLLWTCKKLKLMNGDDYIDAADECKVKRDEKPKPAAGRMLTLEEIDALLKTCLTGPRRRGIRDAAIIMLLVGCGLRRSEICSLQFGEYDPGSGRLLVHGKGSKIRTVYLTNGTATAMRAWLDIRGDEPGPLFYVIYQTDEFVKYKMSHSSIYVMVEDRGKLAQLEHFTPHDLRRTFISDMIPLADLSTIAAIVGHESVNQTMKYDRRNETRKQEAINLLHIPFEQRGEL